MPGHGTDRGARVTLQELAYQGLVGLSQSMYLWLVAAGLTLAFGVMRILNFAHGSLYMVGGYAAFTYYNSLKLTFWSSLVLAALTVAVLGWVVERGLFRPIYGIDETYQLILTWGKAVRVAASDREMAEALGLNTRRVYAAVFTAAAALAGLGGALSVPVRVVTPGVGTSIIIEAFIVTVIGGLGSLPGAFLGSLVVGLATAYGILLLPGVELFAIYLVMAVVLLVRPQGLLGRAVT